MTANESKAKCFFDARKDDETEITRSTPKVAENAANKLNFTSSGEDTHEMKNVKSSTIFRYTKFAHKFDNLFLFGNFPWYWETLITINYVFNTLFLVFKDFFNLKRF